MSALRDGIFVLELLPLVDNTVGCLTHVVGSFRCVVEHIT